MKIRGYRIELTEIESVISAAFRASPRRWSTSTSPSPAPRSWSPTTPPSRVVRISIPGGVAEELRALMPCYMVPAFYEPLDIIPMTTNDKADRKALPTPSGQRLSRSDRDHVAPETQLESDPRRRSCRSAEDRAVCRSEDHFFDDLGTNSLLMARFSSRIRKELEITDFSMRDIYLNPTVRG